MHPLLDLEPAEVAALDRLAQAEQKSAAVLIAGLVRDYLKKRDGLSAIDAAFGCWGDDGEDGLAYQERMRAEWDR